MIDSGSSSGSIDKLISLAQMLYFQGALNPDSPALVIETKVYSYIELITLVRQLAAYLESRKIERLGILAVRTIEAYVAILAAHWIGAAYVPLNPAFPIRRLKKIIENSRLSALVIDQPALVILDLPDAEFLSAYTIIAPYHYNNSASKHFQIIKQEEIKDNFIPLSTSPVVPIENTLAYIIFTSGSTGEPKGVPISFYNLKHFIKVIRERYPLSSDDRVSQFSELSFDVSIFDMYMAWGWGAALYVVPKALLLGSASFIRDTQLTVWLSVPSVISIMEKLNMLKPESFPSLRYSLFTGESLTLHHAKKWMLAAPNSKLENLYGPTEATIDCMVQNVNQQILQTSYREIVPIGKPFPNIYAAVIDADNNFLLENSKGELVIAGAQVIAGYWQNTEASQKKLIELNHPKWGKQKWYLTGDYCLQDGNGIFHYLYRLDSQCKIHGRRIELDEIEYFIRDLTQSTQVLVLIIPTENLDSQIVAIVDIPDLDEAKLKHELRKLLPDYMIPESILYIEKLIYNVTGKLDRQKMSDLAIQMLTGNSGTHG